MNRKAVLKSSSSFSYASLNIHKKIQDLLAKFLEPLRFLTIARANPNLFYFKRDIGEAYYQYLALTEPNDHLFAEYNSDPQWQNYQRGILIFEYHAVVDENDFSIDHIMDIRNALIEAGYIDPDMAKKCLYLDKVSCLVGITSPSPFRNLFIYKEQNLNTVGARVDDGDINIDSINRDYEGFTMFDTVRDFMVPFIEKLFPSQREVVKAFLSNCDLTQCCVEDHEELSVGIKNTIFEQPPMILTLDELNLLGLASKNLVNMLQAQNNHYILHDLYRS